jgi:hypothetical protein
MHENPVLNDRPDDAGAVALRRWAATWVVVGGVIVAVTAVFLTLISNSLVHINADLATADQSVTDVSGHARTLPDQIQNLNASLERIETALRALPEDSGKIVGHLDSVVASLEQIRTDLAGADPELRRTAANLVVSDSTLGPIGKGVHDSADLLAQVLTDTGSIRSALAGISGSGATGLAGVHRNLVAIESVLRAVHDDLGDILHIDRGVNGNLDRVCRSVAVNLLHGPQPC